MKHSYQVNILSVQEVHTLPGIWPDAALRQLLELAEFEDAVSVSEADLLEMVLMALQDLGNQRAGELVLEVIFGDTMRPGVRQNLVDDLQEDEPWADFATVSQQRGLFIAVVLLHQAFPTRYGTPDALKLRFSVRALSESGMAAMESAEPAWVMRLLACGMTDTDVLPRLYEEDLAAGPFPDAPGLIWQFETAAKDAADDRRSRTFELISARLWFSPLSRGLEFQADVPAPLELGKPR